MLGLETLFLKSRVCFLTGAHSAPWTAPSVEKYHSLLYIVVRIHVNSKLNQTVTPSFNFRMNVIMLLLHALQPAVYGSYFY